MDVDDASRIIVDAIETKYTLCNAIPYWIYMKYFDIKFMCFEEIAIQFDLVPDAKNSAVSIVYNRFEHDIIVAYGKHNRKHKEIH